MFINPASVMSDWSGLSGLRSNVAQCGTMRHWMARPWSSCISAQAVGGPPSAFIRLSTMQCNIRPVCRSKV